MTKPYFSIAHLSYSPMAIKAIQQPFQYFFPRLGRDDIRPVPPIFGLVGQRL